MDIIALFSLALNVFTITEECVKKLRNKLTGFGRTSHTAIPCFLLGQFARDDSFSNNDISGRSMLASVIEKIYEAQKVVGGRFLMLDCSDNMISYYEGLGFQYVDSAASKEGLNQMVLFL